MFRIDEFSDGGKRAVEFYGGDGNRIRGLDYGRMRYGRSVFGGGENLAGSQRRCWLFIAITFTLIGLLLLVFFPMP